MGNYFLTIDMATLVRVALLFFFFSHLGEGKKFLVKKGGKHWLVKTKGSVCGESRGKSISVKMGDILNYATRKEKTNCKKKFKKGNGCSEIIFHCNKMDIPSYKKDCSDQGLEIITKIRGKKATKRYCRKQTFHTSFSSDFTVRFRSSHKISQGTGAECKVFCRRGASKYEGDDYQVSKILDEECYFNCQTGFGTHYQGVTSTTKYGTKCQAWNVQTPHEHGYGKVGNHNQCRNPDGVEGGVWCYTTDPHTRWEFCNVANCTDCDIDGCFESCCWKKLVQFPTIDKPALSTSSFPEEMENIEKCAQKCENIPLCKSFIFNGVGASHNKSKCWLMQDRGEHQHLFHKRDRKHVDVYSGLCDGHIYEEAWIDKYCPNIGEFVEKAENPDMMKKNFVNCRQKCLENDRCTAINWCEDREDLFGKKESDCVLRGCYGYWRTTNISVLSYPTWKRRSCKGYVVERDTFLEGIRCKTDKKTGAIIDLNKENTFNVNHTDCLEYCKYFGLTGCEYRRGGGCKALMTQVSTNNQDGDAKYYKCYQFSPNGLGCAYPKLGFIIKGQPSAGHSQEENFKDCAENCKDSKKCKYWSFEGCSTGDVIAKKRCEVGGKYTCNLYEQTQLQCYFNCQTGIGTNYRGVTSVTQSGKKCQAWNVQTPHKHEHGELGDHNQCRNPDGTEGGVWCYTTDYYKRWEHCNVTNCSACDIEIVYTQNLFAAWGSDRTCRYTQPVCDPPKEGHMVGAGEKDIILEKNLSREECKQKCVEQDLQVPPVYDEPLTDPDYEGCPFFFYDEQFKWCYRAFAESKGLIIPPYPRDKQYTMKECNDACRNSTECILWDWRDTELNQIFLPICRLYDRIHSITPRDIARRGKSAVGTKYSCILRECYQDDRLGMKHHTYRKYKTSSSIESCAGECRGISWCKSFSYSFSPKATAMLGNCLLSDIHGEDLRDPEDLVKDSIWNIYKVDRESSCIGNGSPYPPTIKPTKPTDCQAPQDGFIVGEEYQNQLIPGKDIDTCKENCGSCLRHFLYSDFESAFASTEESVKGSCILVRSTQQFSGNFKGEQDTKQSCHQRCKQTRECKMWDWRMQFVTVETEVEEKDVANAQITRLYRSCKLKELSRNWICQKEIQFPVCRMFDKVHNVVKRLTTNADPDYSSVGTKDACFSLEAKWKDGECVEWYKDNDTGHKGYRSLDTIPYSKRLSMYDCAKYCRQEGPAIKACGYDKITGKCFAHQQTVDAKSQLKNAKSDMKCDIMVPEAHCKCGVAKARTKYKVHDEYIEAGKYPWIAMVAYELDKWAIDLHCGATLVASKWAIAAGHCEKKKEKGKRSQMIKYIVLGIFDQSQEWNVRDMDEYKNWVRVEKTIIHEGFVRETLKNDILLLKLAWHVDLTVHVPACLPSIHLGAKKPTPWIKDGIEGFAYGWGTSHICKVNDDHDVITQVKLKILTNEYCEKSEGLALHYDTKTKKCNESSKSYNNKITSEMMCGDPRPLLFHPVEPKNAGTGFCQGDSGGSFTVPDPTTKQHYLAGISSWRYGCGEDFPDVFTRIGDGTGPIMSWISTKIQENGGAVFCTGDYKKHEEYVKKT